jgi:uncharacterized Fe-S cluster-containing radical SAM superfamily enzyme
MKKIVGIPQDAELPLIGLIQIGIIDRGTNLLQIRSTTLCNLNCIFCSTDAGPFSKYHVTEYIVEPSYLTEWVKEVIKFKGSIHAFLDSVGENFTHPRFIDIVANISQLENVQSIALETNGVLLDEGKIEELAELKLSRINLSLHSLNDELNKKLTGYENYSTERILELIEFITKTPIELTLTPVWIPGINDKEIPKLIELAKKIKNKKFPPIGIQKYEAHKFGRKPKNVEPISWWKFYRKLEDWEKQFKMKLKLNPQDFGIEKQKSLPLAFKKFEKVKVEIAVPGWMENEMIGIAKNRAITIVNCKANIGKRINVKILENKNNIYIAR